MNEVIGSLIYVMTCCDLTNFGLSASCHNTHHNQKNNTGQQLNVLRYLKGTMNQELCYKKEEENLKLVACVIMNDKRTQTQAQAGDRIRFWTGRGLEETGLI